MFSQCVVLATLLLAGQPVLAYPQPFEYLKALETFGTVFNHPAMIVEAISPTPLAEDVVGRLDVTTTVIGRELNTEYLFGLFLQGAMENSTENSTQLIGIPSSYTIQSAVIEPPVVAVSFINSIAFPTVNLSVPLQIDMFLSFNEDMLITSYDAVLRRWGEFMNYTLPLLAPKIAEELNQPTANFTELISLKTATDVCQMSTQYCTGDNQQYESHDACMNFITQLPFGQPWEGGMNNGWCRYIHKNMVKYRPSVHCPHIGPSGGDMCIDRDYIEVTNSMPFHSTLLAYNASYNAADVKGVPAANVMELIKIRMQTISMTTVAFYPVSCVLYMLILYIFAKTIEHLLRRLSSQYRSMSFEFQRNTVTYVLDTTITLASLILQLVASPILAGLYTFDNVNIIKVIALLISGLYIFELTYRPSMRLPLLCHHFCTIFAVVLLHSVLSRTGHPAIVVAGEIWGFQATTEQSVFIGLFMYRLRYNLKWTRNILRFGAVQSFIFKISFAAYLLAYWAEKMVQFHSTSEDVALSIMLVALIVLLMCTQIYGAWAVWCLAQKINKSRDFSRPTSVSSVSDASTVATIVEREEKV